MRQIHLLGKNCLFLAILSILTYSCISDSEAPILTELNSEKGLVTETQSDGENLRKKGEFRYHEKFSNQIFPVPSNEGIMLAGTGVGNATFLGKSLSFINQLATSPTTTVGAPVSLVFAAELEELGLVNLGEEVHSVTVDKKGNAIFFSSLINTANPISDIRTEFEAEILIVGGAGSFEGVSGQGKVIGFYNPATGIGESSVLADLQFK